MRNQVERRRKIVWNDSSSLSSTSSSFYKQISLPLSLLSVLYFCPQQCDQMASLFAQYMAICNKNLANHNVFVKVGSLFSKILNKPPPHIGNCQRLVNFHKSSKFRLIWSRWSFVSFYKNSPQVLLSFSLSSISL